MDVAASSMRCRLARALRLKLLVVGGSERVDQVFTSIGGFRVIDPYADPVRIEVRR